MHRRRGVRGDERCGCSTNGRYRSWPGCAAALDSPRIGRRRHRLRRKFRRYRQNCLLRAVLSRWRIYDAIVIGAGHNGLTAAAILSAGLHTLCLDSKLYAGAWPSTVELFDGYNFEIAGSLQFPTSRKVSAELGLDKLPAVDLDVMSVPLRGIGDDPVIYYADPMKLLTHLNDVHGAEAVNGRPDGLEPGADAGIRPLPAGSREARRACGNAGVPRRQHHLPGARHTGQARPRSRSGWRFPTRTPC